MEAVTVDGVLAVVGSVNVNRRSMEKDEEVALVVIDRDTVLPPVFRQEGDLIVVDAVVRLEGANGARPGDFVTVEITDAEEYDLVAVPAGGTHG